MNVVSSTVGFDVSALDPAFKEHATRGIGRYVSELRSGLRALSGEVSVREFSFRNLNGRGIIDRVVDRLPCARQTVRQQLLYPLRLGRLDVDLIHFPAHMDPPAWGMKRYIVTVLDLIPLIFADLYRSNQPGWRFAFARFLERSAIRNAAMIIAISECTARDLQRILGVPRERIVVTPLGVDRKFLKVERREGSERAEILGEFGVSSDRQAILYVGGIDPRKNAHGLIDLFKEVVLARRACGAREPVLLMAGGIEKDREFPELVRHIERSGVAEFVVRTGFVADDKLMALYGACDLFLFPSLYEGFGLTPLEAMAAGLPVVSSHAGAMPEVLGDAALSYAPEDLRAGREAALALLNDPRAALERSMQGRERAALFTWERTARETMGAYARCAAEAWRAAPQGVMS